MMTSYYSVTTTGQHQDMGVDGRQARYEEQKMLLLFPVEPHVCDVHNFAFY